MARITDEERLEIASLYEQDIGTIHGLAAYYDVGILTVKGILDEYGIPHGKHTMHHNMQRGERPMIRIYQRLHPTPEMPILADGYDI